MGFFDKLGGFLEAMVNAGDKMMDNKVNNKDASLDDLTRAGDWYSKRAGQECCKRCGGALASSGDYCYKCRKEMGMI